MRKVSEILLVSVFLFLFADCLSQEYNYARLSVLYGNNISFNFRSISDYKDGIRIDNGTLLGITMADSNNVAATLEGFSLRFRAFNSQASIEGTAGNLPLISIQLEATNSMGLPAPEAFYTGLQDLSTAWIDLVQYIQNPVSPPDFTNLNWANHQVNISYECGIGNGSLLGMRPDYYTVEIELQLIPIGPGF